MEMPSTLDFIIKMQNDFREMEYKDANEAQAQNYVSEYVCKQIIEALEKQMPKKPDLEGDGYADDGQLVYDTWICPCCGKRYELGYDDYEYCPKCGQAIDWSEYDG